MEPTQAWMWYRGLRRYVGEWRAVQWRITKRKWRRANPEPLNGYICVDCNNPIRPVNSRRSVNPEYYDFTLDHIIPQSEIVFNGLDINLLFDHSNLQPMHQYCNTKKGNKIL